MVMPSKREIQLDQIWTLTRTVDAIRNSASSPGDDNFADFTIECGRDKFPAHRVILSGGCPYFRALFRSGMREVDSGRVELRDVGGDAMRAALAYIYTGGVTVAHDDFDGVKGVLAAAHLLQLNALYRYCWQVLCTERVLRDNFAELWHLADHYDDAEATGAIVSFVAAHFYSASGSAQFLDLTVAQMKLLLGHPNLDWCTTSDQVALSILAWDRNDACAHSERDVSDLFALSSLNFISNACLQQLLAFDIVKRSPDILAILYRLASAKLEFPETKLRLFCFSGCNASASRVSVYSHGVRQWSDQLAPLPFCITKGTVAVQCGGFFYFVGGGDESGVALSRSIFKYSPSTNTAVEAGRLVRPRLNVGLAVLADRIYVVGGKRQTAYPQESEYYAVNDVERYDPEAGTVESLSPTHGHYNHPRVVTIQGELFVTDGSSVETYSTASDQWTLLNVRKTIPSGSRGLQVAGFKNKLCVFLSDARQPHLRVYSHWTRKWDECDITGGPNLFSGVWGTEQAHLPFLLVADDRGVLYKFDPRLLQWDKLTEPRPHLRNWNWWQTAVLF